MFRNFLEMSWIFHHSCAASKLLKNIRTPPDASLAEFWYMRQPAFLRLPFVCGQTHICEFSPSLHSTNKTKKVSKETWNIVNHFFKMTAGLAALRCAAASLIACGNRHSCVCLSFAVKLTSVSSRPRCTALIKQKRSQKRPFFFIGALGGTRTHNLLIRSQMLYPIKLRAQRLDILIEQKKYKCKHFFQFFLFFCTKA